MSTAIVTAVIGSIATVTVAIISMVSSVRAQKTSAATARRQVLEAKAHDAAQERARVEADAYNRARQSYEQIVRDLERQLERNQRTVELVQSQLDTVMERLVREQDTSSSLRTQLMQMTVLQQRFDELQRENEAFHTALDKHRQESATLDSQVEQAIRDRDPAR